MGDLILAIDASTQTGTVAVFSPAGVLAERAVAMRGETEERLMPAVIDALAAAAVAPASLAAIVCGAGPGSFTSLRIAASIAKGIAIVRRTPLYAVSSFELAAVEAGVGRWLLVMDAMRGEAFAAAYEWDGARLRVPADVPARLPRDDAADLADSHGLTVREANPHARAAAPLWRHIAAGDPVDLATWEPEYGRLAEAQVRWEAEHGPLRA
jgi:tRNA threonylcarbamoyladenosine biosynthesis protein TsaB